MNINELINSVVNSKHFYSVVCESEEEYMALLEILGANNIYWSSGAIAPKLNYWVGDGENDIGVVLRTRNIQDAHPHAAIPKTGANIALTRFHKRNNYMIDGDIIHFKDLSLKQIEITGEDIFEFLLE